MTALEHEDVETYTGEEWKTYTDILFGVAYKSIRDGKIYVDYTFPTYEHAVIVAEHLEAEHVGLKFQVVPMPVFNDVEAVLRTIQKVSNKT